MSKYHDKIKKLKYLQTVLVIFCILVIVVYSYVITRPKIITFNYVDLCSLMPGGGGAVSHTVGNEDDCRNVCYNYCGQRSACIADNKNYCFEKSEFKLRDGPICNLCTCYCKE